MAVYGGGQLVTDGLIYSVDLSSTRSYPGSGTSINSIAGSSFGNTNTITGATFVSNNPKYLTFNGKGTTENVAVSSQNITFSDGEEWSVDIWMMKTGSIESYEFFIGNIGSNPNFVIYGDYLRFREDGGTYNVILSNINSYKDIWNHFAFSCDGTHLTTYWNGVASGNVVTPATTTFNVAEWGDGYSSNTWPFRGNIGCVHVYNKALSSTEALQNHNATKGRFL